MPPTDFVTLFEGAEPQARRELLRARFRYDIEGFCRWCWSDRFNLPFTDLHHDLIDVARERPAWDERTNSVRSAIAAPRGYAKTTISSFALPAHRIVYGLEAFVVLGSAEGELAVDLSRDLRQAFLDEESPLRDLFGPFEVEGGVKGWQVSVAGAPSVGVLPKSERSAIRGRKHPTRGIRPTLIVLDDAEDKVRVLNPRLRQFTWNWLTKDILKAGRQEGGTDVWWRGTVLHVDSALARLISGREHGWASARYQAILSWPERTDLWERCRQIWSDLTLGEHRRPAAVAFYRANQTEMQRGAEILGGLQHLFRLYEQIWAEGLASFLQEMQNDPTDPSARVFEPDKWVRHHLEDDQIVLPTGRRVPLRDLRKVVWWDPTVGGPSGDFGAIAVLGRDGFGYTHVLDLWIRRAKPDEQLDALWPLCERWGVRRAWYEDNGFQELVAGPFARQREEREEQGKFWQLTLVGETSTANKVKRIAAMQPDTANGWMTFSDRLPAELTQQAEAFPTADHDDALDAIERAWTKLGGTPVRMSEQPAVGGRG